ncbi:MAG: DNA polymerase III subunit gamma/tau [Dehalococcoidia bacterium]
MPGNSQVFYRKWRPRRFDDVVGQEHVSNTLKRAIATERVAHAYLFTGPRGVGKTSSARILAKALNCTSLQDGEPDDTCDNCIAVNEDRMMDLVEIDAASNRRIDDIRNLREKVQYEPVAGRWKVYIIDEVHMLTTEAFNALLKTLEEPPPRIVMVLATTDVHKVPVTIVSRCQRYDFKRLSNDDVIDRLAELCGAEDIECEPEVLAMIARAAWGSLRDAENLLEQLAVSYGQEITEEQARELLGLGDTGASLEMAVALLEGDTATALGVINREAARGADLRGLRNGAVDAVRAALLQKAGVQDALSHSSEVLEAMSTPGKQAKMEKLLHVLSVLGQADLKGDSSSPLPLELAVLKAASAPVQAVAAGAVPAPMPSQGAPAGGPGRYPSGPQQGQAPQPQRQPPSPSQEEEPRQRRPTTPAHERWNQVLHTLRRTKIRRYVLGALLRNVEVVDPEDGRLVLKFRSTSLRENLQEELQDARAREALKKAVADAYGADLEVEIGDPDGNGGGKDRSDPALDSPLVRAAMTMGARVMGEEELPGEDK